MEREDVLRKINKIMAIANDKTANDQEVQLAVYRANQLRIKYKIEEEDLFNQEAKLEDVYHMHLNDTGVGYIYWVLRPLCKYFQCSACYVGKIDDKDVTFAIYGLLKDLVICFPIAANLLSYLTRLLTDMEERYQDEIYFDYYCRSYLAGFAAGLKEQLQKSVDDLHLEPNDCQLAVVGVPEVVKEWEKKHVRSVSTRFFGKDESAYMSGKNCGYQYEIGEKALLKD